MMLFKTLLALTGLAFSLAALSADNPIIGDWQAKVPRSNKILSLSFTKDIATFGNEKPESYRLVREGNGYLLYIGKEKRPGMFTPRGPNRADFALPNGVTLPLTRVASGGSVSG